MTTFPYAAPLGPNLALLTNAWVRGISRLARVNRILYAGCGFGCAQADLAAHTGVGRPSPDRRITDSLGRFPYFVDRWPLARRRVHIWNRLAGAAALLFPTDRFEFRAIPNAPRRSFSDTVGRADGQAVCCRLALCCGPHRIPSHANRRLRSKGDRFDRLPV